MKNREVLIPRAHRHYLPGYTWHLTHRCHNKEFLLREPGIRLRWVHWLREARKREGLKVLNYAVTRNHIHLIVIDDGSSRCIQRSMQLIEGRTAQEYNDAFSRRGAFWEDRYHATAIDSRRHLLQCVIYIDLNMVRAGVVTHPREWLHCGFHEIRNPKKRNGIIAHPKLLELLGTSSHDEMIKMLDSHLSDLLVSGHCSRESKWTEAVAVGSKHFLQTYKEKLSRRGGRKNIRWLAGESENLILREESMVYESSSGTTDGRDYLSGENKYSWLECGGSPFGGG
ncbi:MAG: transposase [Chitinivibrionales bacterium]|nr:transposase [Chitinivibrionales bacterium]MBD3358524.1 transposase [Chitinivibrionales bacterium]